MESILLVATGASQLKKIAGIAARQPMVVFGTMNRTKLSQLSKELAENSKEPRTPIYFYETG